MDIDKRHKLERAGWKIGSADEFLSQTFKAGANMIIKCDTCECQMDIYSETTDLEHSTQTITYKCPLCGCYDDVTVFLY